MPKLIRGVFEGGGAKGSAFVGALRALDEMGIWFSAVAGTSAGSITAAPIAAGYTASEIAALSDPSSPTRVDFGAFKDRGWAPWIALGTCWGSAAAEAIGSLTSGLTGLDLGSWDDSLLNVSAAAGCLLCTGGFAWLATMLRRLHWDGGWFLGNAFREWMRRLLRAKLGLDRDVVFRDLGTLPGTIPLTVVACDLNPVNYRTRVIYFNEKNTPDFPVHVAVRASMSIPLMFTTVRVGFGYPGKAYNSDLVDGGVLSNLPLDCFANKLGNIGKDVFGFLLDEGPPDPKTLSWLVPTLARLQTAVHAMRTYHDSLMQTKYADQVVRLPTLGVRTGQFRLDSATFRKLNSTSYEVTRHHPGLMQFAAAVVAPGGRS